MTTTGAIAGGITAVAFLGFYVMATIMVKQLSLKEWRAALMAFTVLILLLLIMHKATEIGTGEGGWGAAVESIDGQLPEID